MPSYYELNREKELARARAYRQQNKAKRSATQKAWCAANPEAAKAIGKRTREKNKDKRAQRAKEWYRKNAERIKAKRKARYHEDEEHRSRAREYSSRPEVIERRRETGKNPERRAKFNANRNRRLKEDENFRLRSVIGSRISVLVSQRRTTKCAKTMELIGCDIAFLREYLQARFKPGMSWANYGEWHIDHRIPCAKFDLTQPEHQRQCFHYSNLQPMWEIENISKGARMPAPHQAELV